MTVAPIPVSVNPSDIGFTCHVYSAIVQLVVDSPAKGDLRDINQHEINTIGKNLCRSWLEFTYEHGDDKFLAEISISTGIDIWSFPDMQLVTQVELDLNSMIGDDTPPDRSKLN